MKLRFGMTPGVTCLLQYLNLPKKNDIVMFTFRPLPNHKLQPLDRTMFGYNVLECVGTVYHLAFTPTNLQLM